MTYHRTAIALALSLLVPLPAIAAGGGAAAYLKKPDAWFASADGKRIAANILSYQSDLGGWPKNTDTVDAPYTGDRNELHPTFDNSATTDELRFIARCYNASKDETDLKAFSKGLAYILKAQYPTGGWPQYYPPSKQYHRYITFNDGAMVRLLEFLREVNRTDTYNFVPAADRKAAGETFEKGIACILKCQIKVDGKPTVWCAQHDEIDYSPRPARAFELASFSGSESVGIVRLLMSLDHPSPEVIAAVDGAVAWFESAKITGIRLERIPDPKSEKGTNLVVVPDPTAPPQWARFYDLKTQKPFFCDRDGIPKPTIAEIGYERRNGYAWYGNWPQDLLEKEYPAWKKRVK
ncbi:MAG: pectate lyase [Luteolibacter sp.]